MKLKITAMAGTCSRLISSLALGLMLLSSSVPAQTALPPEGQRAVDLMWACQSKGRHYKYAVEVQWDGELFGQIDFMECTSYLAGIADTSAMGRGTSGQSLFCFPQQGISGEQQVRIFLKWAEAHPEMLHESRHTGATSAFAQAFPCN